MVILRLKGMKKNHLKARWKVHMWLQKKAGLLAIGNFIRILVRKIEIMNTLTLLTTQTVILTIFI